VCVWAYQLILVCIDMQEGGFQECGMQDIAKGKVLTPL